MATQATIEFHRGEFFPFMLYAREPDPINWGKLRVMNLNEAAIVLEAYDSGGVRFLVTGIVDGDPALGKAKLLIMPAHTSGMKAPWTGSYRVTVTKGGLPSVQVAGRVSLKV